MQSEESSPKLVPDVVEHPDGAEISDAISKEAGKRIEARLSAESAEVLNRRMQQIWSEAMQQLEPLVDALHRDDEASDRQVTQHVGVAMQVHSFDPNGTEERKNLRVIKGDIR